MGHHTHLTGTLVVLLCFRFSKNLWLSFFKIVPSFVLSLEVKGQVLYLLLQSLEMNKTPVLILISLFVWVFFFFFQANNVLMRQSTSGKCPLCLFNVLTLKTHVKLPFECLSCSLVASIAAVHRPRSLTNQKVMMLLFRWTFFFFLNLNFIVFSFVMGRLVSLQPSALQGVSAVSFLSH